MKKLGKQINHRENRENPLKRENFKCFPEMLIYILAFLTKASRTYLFSETKNERSCIPEAVMVSFSNFSFLCEPSSLCILLGSV